MASDGNGEGGLVGNGRETSIWSTLTGYMVKLRSSQNNPYYSLGSKDGFEWWRMSLEVEVRRELQLRQLRQSTRVCDLPLPPFLPFASPQLHFSFTFFFRFSLRNSGIVLLLRC